jgi:chromosome segregation ATPase
MTDDERDYKDWLQSREIDTALATIEAAQDEYDAMVHRLNDALADRDRLRARVAELEAALWEMLSHYAPDPDDDTEAAVTGRARR